MARVSHSRSHVETIYRRPDDYDLEHEGDDEDIRCLVSLAARERPKRVLELASGSGRLAVPLARRAAQDGFDVVGLEISDEMRSSAAAKIEEEPPEVRERIALEAGDMRTWRSSRPFEVIVCACSSVTHLLTIDDQLAAWRTAYDNLAPGGCFIVDVVMPHLPAYADSLQTPPRTLVELDVDAEDPATGARLLRYKTTIYLPHEQRATIRFLYDKFEGRHSRTHGGQGAPDAERYVSDFESHVYFPRELQLLFLGTGFKVEAIHGDYRLRPMHRTSRQMLVIGRK